MRYDEARAQIRSERENQYGRQWKRHLDRYGPNAYIYELLGIMGRLESMVIEKPPEEVFPTEQVQDKLLDLGNYASFIYDWLEHKKMEQADQEFRDNLP